MKIASIQTDIIWENSEANKIHYDQLLKCISKVDLIIFPEMFTTGFSMNNHKISESPRGDTLKWMQRHAQNKKTTIIGSIPVKEKNRYYNRLFVVNHEVVKFYDKRYLFSMGGESQKYSRGNKDLIIEIKGWKINPLICYDLRFPVWSKNKIIENNYKYDILVYIANWPAVRSKAWESLLKARAIENSSYVIGVNRIGVDGNKIVYNGASRIFDYTGERLDNFPINQTHIVVCDFDKNQLIKYREKFPVLKDADQFSFHL